MYTLYSIPGSCSTGITVLMKKLGLDFKVIRRDDVENYTDLVPTNQVPALIDGDTLITEGAAIVLHLLEKHENDMLPKSEKERTEFYRWLMFDYATLHPAYGKLFSVAGVMDDSEAKLPLLQKLADKISDTFNILDKRLEDRQFIYGDVPTPIDYLAAVYSTWGNSFPQLSFNLGDNVKAHVQRVMALPEFQAAYEFEGIELSAAA